MNDMNAHFRACPAAKVLPLQDCSKEPCRTTDKRLVLQPAVFGVSPVKFHVLYTEVKLGVISW